MIGTIIENEAPPIHDDDDMEVDPNAAIPPNPAIISDASAEIRGGLPLISNILSGVGLGTRQRRIAKIEGENLKKIGIAIPMEPPTKTKIRIQEVEEILDTVKYNLEEGYDPTYILETLKSHQLEIGRIAYFIFMDFFESAKENFLASMEGEAALRAAKSELKSKGEPNPSSEEIKEAAIVDNREIINRSVLTQMEKFIADGKLSTVVRETVLAERFAEKVARYIGFEIQSASDEFTTEPEIPNVLIDAISQPVQATLCALAIQALAYKIRVGLMTKDELKAANEKLVSLKAKSKEHTATQVSQGIRILKHIMRKTYAAIRKSKGEAALNAELGDEKQLEEACRLLGDTNFGDEFTSDACLRELRDAKYILFSMEEHLRRTEFQPFSLYDWNLANPLNSLDTKSPAHDPTHPLYDIKLANIDLFAPPLKQHLPCFVRVIASYLESLLRKAGK